MSSTDSTPTRDMRPEGLNSLSHYVVGVLTVVAYLFSPVLSVLSFTLFFVYEVGQYWYEEDQPSKEIREFGVGFYLTLLLLFYIYVI